MSEASQGVFHGWKILGVVFLTQGVVTGFTTYAFGFFVKPIEAEFGVDRSTVQWGLTAQLPLIALISPFIGRQLDRRSIRTVMLVGSLSLTVALCAVAWSHLLWLTGIAYAVGLSIAMACLGPLASSKLLVSWFIRSRERVLGISAVGTSIAGFLAPPLLQLAIDSWGWRGAVLAAAGVGTLLTLPWIALLVHNRPSDLGLHADGAASSPAPPPGGTVTWDFASLARDRNFWVITLAAGTMMASVGGLVPSLAPYLDGIGIEGQRAALLFPFLSSGGIIGKLSFAAVANRFDKRVLLALTIGVVAGFLLLLISEPAYPALAAGTFAFGLALGGVLPLWSAILAECYGAESFGQVMGAMGPAMLPLNVAAIQGLPWAYDHYGSYVPAFQVLLVALLLAALTTTLLRRPRATLSDG